MQGGAKDNAGDGFPPRQRVRRATSARRGPMREFHQAPSAKFAWSANATGPLTLVRRARCQPRRSLQVRSILGPTEVNEVALPPKEGRPIFAAHAIAIWPQCCLEKIQRQSPGNRAPPDASVALPSPTVTVQNPS